MSLTISNFFYLLRSRKVIFSFSSVDVFRNRDKEISFRPIYWCVMLRVRRLIKKKKTVKVLYQEVVLSGIIQVANEDVKQGAVVGLLVENEPCVLRQNRL